MPAARTVRVLAPAKVNLALHVTGQRADGYHLLDSLVVFAPFGDTITLAEGPGDMALRLDGPEAAGLGAGDDNLALRGARLAGPDLGGTLTLTKALPLASGIGGGSADAAAAVRAVLALRGVAHPRELPAPERSALLDGLLALGSDVPVCLDCAPMRLGGIGQDLAPAPSLPPLPAVLVNPRVPVSTPAVYGALRSKANPGLPVPPSFADAPTLIRWLAGQRNDLQAPAMALHPEIAPVLAALAAQPGAGLVRMSGSGATCFGLFAALPQALQAADLLRALHPGWWVRAGVLGDQSGAATAQVR